jgi:hypothetical protein
MGNALAQPMAFFILTLGKKGAAKRPPSVNQMRNQDNTLAQPMAFFILTLGKKGAAKLPPSVNQM